MLYVFRKTPFRPVVNGDDSNPVTPAGADVDVSDFALLGLKTKVDCTGDRWVGDFCQLSLIDTTAGPIAVRDPYRVMSRTPYTCKKYNNESGYRKYLGAVGLCEMACNVGVPVLQEYATMIYRSAGDISRVEFERLAHIRGDVRYHGPATIDGRARMSFFLAFGIPPNQQVELEELFRQTTLPFGELVSD